MMELITQRLAAFPRIELSHRVHLVRRNTHHGLDVDGTVLYQRGIRSRITTHGIVSTEHLAPGDRILATHTKGAGCEWWVAIDESLGERWIKATRLQQLNANRDWGGPMIDSQWWTDAWGARSRFIEVCDLLLLQCERCQAYVERYDLEGETMSELFAVCGECGQTGNGGE